MQIIRVFIVIKLKKLVIGQFVASWKWMKVMEEILFQEERSDFLSLSLSLSLSLYGNTTSGKTVSSGLNKIIKRSMVGGRDKYNKYR